MSQAEALLASLAEVVPEHTHTVTDSDTYFVIDPITRTMENTARKKNVIMQYDHESEVLTFEIPRYVEGHDMTLCNRVYSHWNNIDAKTKEETADVHELTDLRLNPDNPDTVICSWLIKRQSTMHAGILSFLIQYKCVDDAGNDVYEWHTDIYDSMEVRKGRRNNQAAIVEYTDILEQWYARLFGTGEGILTQIDNASTEAQEAITNLGNEKIREITTEGTTQIETIKQESAAQQSAIVAKGQETLDSIPPDYTEMYRMAEEAMRTKADAIVVDVEGEYISVSNASDDPLQNLRIFGKTEQFTTTGKNLLDVSENRSFTGVYSKDITIPAGSYIISWAGATWDGADAPFVRFTANDKWIQVSSSAGTGILTLDKEEDHLYMYSNGSSAVNSEGVSATIDRLMVSVDGGEYEPYTGGKASPSPDYPQELENVENAEIHICGKNLARYPNDYDYSGAGIAIHITKDSSEVLIDGTAEKLFSNTIMKSILLPPGKYTVSAQGINIHDSGHDRLYVASQTTSKVLVNYIRDGSPGTFELTEPTAVRVDMVFKSGTVYSNQTIKIQIELGEEATDYEPYKPVQTLATQRTLNAVDGIKDELVYNYQTDTWQYVQRIGEAVFNGTDPWGYATGGETRFVLNLNAAGFPSGFENDKSANCLCSHYIAAPHSIVYQTHYTAGVNGGYLWICNPEYADIDSWKVYLSELYAAGTPLTVLYILAEPIITELTTEEVMAFKALRTNKPNTVIQNGVGAYMIAEYNADTEIFMRENQPGPTDEQINNAVNTYLDTNGVQVPSDDHIRALIDEALGEIVNGEY